MLKFDTVVCLLKDSVFLSLNNFLIMTNKWHHVKFILKGITQRVIDIDLIFCHKYSYDTMQAVRSRTIFLNYLVSKL